VGNPFASQSVSDPIPLPFDPPHTVTVRKLTGREVEAAAAAHRSGLAGGNARSWPEKLKRALQYGATDPEVLKAIQDPLTGYDRFALVRSGLVAWSYPLPIKRIDTPATGTTVLSVVDAVEDLDDEAVDFIATEVLRLTKPALFYATEEVAEAEKKSG
jgi:hypothetical protein